MKFKKTTVCIIGTGYVGLVSGVCLAEIGHNVICIDNNKDKIAKLKKGINPIYEPGLEDLIKKNIKNGRLSFSLDIDYGVKSSEVIFICVNTPTQKNGKTDLRYVQAVSKQVAKSMKGHKVVVSKSTISVGTSQKIKEMMQKFCSESASFDIVFNPEFLREGSAVKDFLHPDRIVIGVESLEAEKVMRALYQPIKAPYMVTSIESAEIIKHACNAFLATKISFINAIANICEKNGGHIDEVTLAMGLDKRIGKEFLRAGIGFGGSCFPKDVAAFTRVAKDSGYDFRLLKEVQLINWRQREHFVKKVESALGDLKNKKIAVLGLAFKSNTDDMREAPSVDIIHSLLKKGAKVYAYDPAAMERGKEIFKSAITYGKNIYEVAKGAEALLILTEWEEFSKMNLKEVKRLLKNPIIVDGRNIFAPKTMSSLGFTYYSVGRKNGND